MREGFGKFFYANGATYEGQWKLNKKWGYALFIDENGLGKYGYFNNDRMIREIYVMDVLFDIYVNKLQSLQNNKQIDNNNKGGIDEVDDDPEHPRESSPDFSPSNSIIEFKKKKFTDISSDIEPLNKENIYIDLLKIQDFVPEKSFSKTLHLISEIMLRFHSDLKKWYNNLCQENKDLYEDGFFMTYRNFWNLIEKLRLFNGRFNKVNFNHFMKKCYPKDFKLEFNEKEIAKEVDLAERYDLAKPEEQYSDHINNSPHNNNSHNSEETKKLENNPQPKIEEDLTEEQLSEKILEMILEDHQKWQKRKSNSHNSDQIMLFRSFINAIVSKIIYNNLKEQFI